MYSTLYIIQYSQYYVNVSVSYSCFEIPRFSASTPGRRSSRTTIYMPLPHLTVLFVFHNLNCRPSNLLNKKGRTWQHNIPTMVSLPIPIPMS